MPDNPDSPYIHAATSENFQALVLNHTYTTPGNYWLVVLFQGSVLDSLAVELTPWSGTGKFLLPQRWAEPAPVSHPGTIDPSL